MSWCDEAKAAWNQLNAKLDEVSQHRIWYSPSDVSEACSFEAVLR